jgi:hypothetical protein
VGNPERRRPLGRSRSRWVDIITSDQHNNNGSNFLKGFGVRFINY